MTNRKERDVHHIAPPNNGIEFTVKSVMPFAKAKRALLLPAARLDR
jgi:hypothetical protein